MIEKIGVWGDSILKGVVLDKEAGRYVRLNQKCCVSCVEKELNVPIENFSRFGVTSEKGKHMMEKGIEKLSPGHVAVIEYGGNDIDFHWEQIAQEPEKEHQPQTPPEQYRKNMEDMVELAMGREVVPVLVTLPPIDPKRYFDWLSRDIEKKENILKWLGGVETIYRAHAAYDQIIREVAEKFRCHLIDVRRAFTQQGDYNDYLCLDGIHPNERGHNLMEKTFYQYSVPYLA